MKENRTVNLIFGKISNSIIIEIISNLVKKVHISFICDSSNETFANALPARILKPDWILHLI